MSRYLAMFPLGSVLVPTQVLPLHIFEERYRALMQDLTEPGSPGEIGVVLIERGSEVGGGDVRSGAGTLAQLIQAEHLEDGRWLAVFAGSHRVRVSRWLPDDPYPAAEVEELPDEPWDPLDAGALALAEQAVRDSLRLSAELGDPVARPGFALSPDPVLASWELCHFAPLGPLDRQKLLEKERRAERLQLLSEQVADAARVLAFRLRGR